MASFLASALMIYKWKNHTPKTNKKMRMFCFTRGKQSNWVSKSKKQHFRTFDGARQCLSDATSHTEHQRFDVCDNNKICCAFCDEDLHEQRLELGGTVVINAATRAVHTVPTTTENEKIAAPNKHHHRVNKEWMWNLKCKNINKTYPPAHAMVTPPYAATMCINEPCQQQTTSITQPKRVRDTKTQKHLFARLRKTKATEMPRTFRNATKYMGMKLLTKWNRNVLKPKFRSYADSIRWFSKRVSLCACVSECVCKWVRVWGTE